MSVALIWGCFPATNVPELLLGQDSVTTLYKDIFKMQSSGIWYMTIMNGGTWIQIEKILKNCLFFS